jgi:hypothetical protein
MNMKGGEALLIHYHLDNPIMGPWKFGLTSLSTELTNLKVAPTLLPSHFTASQLGQLGCGAKALHLRSQASVFLWDGKIL